MAQEGLSWFPFIICMLVALAVAGISKCVNRESLLISNFIFLMGGLELILYLVLMIQAFIWGASIMAALVIIAILALIALDLIWWLVCYRRRLPQDEGF